MIKILVSCFCLLIIIFSCTDPVKPPIQAVVSETIPVDQKRDTTIIPIPTEEIIREFYDAIDSNDATKVRQMLGTKYPGNYEFKGRVTPLQFAIWENNLAIVKMLVENGANINSNQKSAVVEAAEYKTLQILQYLLDHGGSMDNEAFNKSGFHQFYEGARLLLLRGANQEKGDIRGKLWIILEAARKSDYDVLNTLKLEKGNLDENNYDGETPLIIAVKNNDVKLVEYLLKKGVDKNKPETFDGGDDIHYGKRPIGIAKEKGFQEIVEMLL